MSARLHSGRVYNALKARFRLLVDTCGGPNSAERISRISQQQISRCGSVDEEHANRFAPIDEIADLEAHCGKPVVTEYLAELSGYVLVRVPDAAATDAVGLVSRVSEMLREVSDVSGGVADALRDNRVTRREAKGVHKEVREAIQKLVEIDREVDLVARSKPEGDEDD
ncbi:MAG: hypothetical protein KKB37_11235 [Alphaproteobacteria bacterium]|nr:hypothetical protein [Alphaproteobacteria bacterium]